MVAVLKACGNNLTRENLMTKRRASMTSSCRCCYPGVIVSTSENDCAPIKRWQFQKFDGTTWQLFGNVILG